MDANFHSVAPSTVRELQDLRAQVMQARAVLAGLRRQIAGAQRQVDFDDSASLVEVNEQLIVAALQNQTVAEQAKEALGELSKSYAPDLLTQLPNRVPLKDRFSHAIANAQRQGNRMAVLFMDINGFKSINDTLGHDAGDEVLKHTAHCIARSIRDVDFVCRYGGDEFVVLVTEVAQADDADVVAQKIASAVASAFTVVNTTLSVSLSIGVAIYPEDGADAKTLIRCADAAMYQAKRSNVNRRSSASR